MDAASATAGSTTSTTPCSFQKVVSNFPSFERAACCFIFDYAPDLSTAYFDHQVRQMGTGRWQVIPRTG